MNRGESLTIMIPTLNRFDFLKRAMHYYKSVGFAGYILIGDSSNTEIVEKTKRVIELLNDSLKIIYHTCPPPLVNNADPMGTPGEANCLKQLIELVPTKYAAIAGDDDFQVPSGLVKCVEFLEAHAEYSAAHGIRIDVQLKSVGAYGGLASAYYVQQPVLEAATASERWSTYMKHAISPAYSVHRTETCRMMFRDLDCVPMRYLGSELLPSSFSEIQGKVKELDYLSTIHQDNDDRVWGWDTQSMYALITHPNWYHAARGLRRSISTSLAKYDGIDTKAAEAVFDKEFWGRISRMMQWQYKIKYGTDRASGARSENRAFWEPLKRVPGLTALARSMRTRRIDQTVNHGYRDSVSLESLLTPSSPFHVDFMPVYRAILGGTS